MSMWNYYSSGDFQIQYIFASCLETTLNSSASPCGDTGKRFEVGKPKYQTFK